MNLMNTTKPQTPVTNKALTQRYQRAQQFESAAIGFRTPVLNDRVVPHWIAPDAESPTLAITLKKRRCINL